MLTMVLMFSWVGSYLGITILSLDREGCELHDEQGENEKYINSFSNSI